MEDRGASADEMRELLGRGRAKKGIFEGDLVEGELEIGQVASLVNSVVSAEQVVNEIVEEYNRTIELLSKTYRYEEIKYTFIFYTSFVCPLAISTANKTVYA